MGFALPLVQMGIGLLGGLFGRKKRKELEKRQTAGFKGMETAGGSLQSLGGEYGKLGTETAAKGVGGLTGAQDYYTKLMGGDPQALNELTGGTASDQARTLQQGYQGMARGGRRSGATAAAAASAPMQLASALRALQMKGRFAGAQGATETGSALGQLGGQYGQIGERSFEGAGNVFGNLASGAGGALAAAQKQSSDLGAGLSNLAGSVFGGGKGGNNQQSHGVWG